MNELHLDNLKQEIERLFLENKYDILLITFGQKQVNGQFTTEKCVRFGVKQKLSIQDIPADKLIPRTLTIDGVDYKTDVVIVPEKISAQPAYCWNTGTQAIPPVVSAPVSYNRAKTVILSGGKSIFVEYQRIVALDRENGSEIRVFVNVTFMVFIRTPCECITATVSERKLC